MMMAFWGNTCEGQTMHHACRIFLIFFLLSAYHAFVLASKGEPFWGRGGPDASNPGCGRVRLLVVRVHIRCFHDAFHRHEAIRRHRVLLQAANHDHIIARMLVSVLVGHLVPSPASSMWSPTSTESDP